MATTSKLITGPAEEPITLEEAKSYLAYSDSLQDDEINAAIRTGRQQAEKYIRRPIISQTYELALDGFWSEIRLDKIPATTINSVRYLDADGIEQTVNPANYAIDDYSAFTWLVPVYGYSWPDTQGGANCVKVQYVAGMAATAAALSDQYEDVKSAIKIAVVHQIRFQSQIEQGTVFRMPRQFEDYLRPYRIVRV